MIANIITIDVEDYFQVENFADVVKFSAWDKYESRVVKNTEKLLAQLAKFDTKATFFVLGWVAEKYPALVREIHQAGHEISSHGYAHQLIYTQTEDEFRSDLKRGKTILENIINEPVLGYRAPSFSITKKSLWAFDILNKEGFRYDSSFSSVRYGSGGLPEEKKSPHKINSRLWEFPVSIGGGYFRLYPYGVTAGLIKRMNKKGHPAIIYLHPWELDPAQPRIKTGALRSFRHYINLEKTKAKLERLLCEFKFGTIREQLRSTI